MSMIGTLAGLVYRWRDALASSLRTQPGPPFFPAPGPPRNCSFRSVRIPSATGSIPSLSGISRPSTWDSHQPSGRDASAHCIREIHNELFASPLNPQPGQLPQDHRVPGSAQHEGFRIQPSMLHMLFNHVN